MTEPEARICKINLSMPMPVRMMKAYLRLNLISDMLSNNNGVAENIHTLAMLTDSNPEEKPTHSGSA